MVPVIARTRLSALDLLTEPTEPRDRLWRNTRHFRSAMTALGFEILPCDPPIVPVMLRDPKLAQSFAHRLRDKGVPAVAFSFPVVPRGQDRIRAQRSAAHEIEELDRALGASAEVGRELGVVE